MSNTLANHQQDEIDAKAQPEEVTITLDRDNAEALMTLIGITGRGDDNPYPIYRTLRHFCNGESSYTVNEPDDTLRLRKV